MSPILIFNSLDVFSLIIHVLYGGSSISLPSSILDKYIMFFNSLKLFGVIKVTSCSLLLYSTVIVCVLTSINLFISLSLVI